MKINKKVLGLCAAGVLSFSAPLCAAEVEKVKTEESEMQLSASEYLMGVLHAIAQQNNIDPTEVGNKITEVVLQLKIMRDDNNLEEWNQRLQEFVIAVSLAESFDSLDNDILEKVIQRLVQMKQEGLAGVGSGNIFINFVPEVDDSEEALLPA